MVKTKMVIASDHRERSDLFSVKKDRRVGPAGLLAMTSCLGLSILLSSCSPLPARIPEIPNDHSANAFYQAAQTGMLPDKVCRDHGGNPSIPAGEVKTGEKYTRSRELAPGVFYFGENATGTKYLGVSFLQYSGFLQIPKLCSWEEKE